MTYLDRYLQIARINHARPFINKGDRILDIGSMDDTLFRSLAGYIGYSVGIDPLIPFVIKTPNYELIPGSFPDVCPLGNTYDTITLLAVLEHIPIDAQVTFAAACATFLRPGGRLIITVPSPRVDKILNILMKLKLVEGMSTEQHYGYDTSSTPSIFTPHGFKLIQHTNFQLGLNNLFVFKRL